MYKTWLTPNLREAENEDGRQAKGGKERDVSDKVEPRDHLGSTFRFYGNSGR
jgi:hypothetical protein